MQCLNRYAAFHAWRNERMIKNINFSAEVGFEVLMVVSTKTAIFSVEVSHK
jgi:hypothetical protein